MDNSTNNIDFETTLKELEMVVNRLENGDLPLEEAVNQFAKGMQLAQQGQERLQQAEQQVQILLNKNVDSELSQYQPEDDCF